MLPNWIEKAENLYKQQLSFTEIGRRLNVDRKKVSYYLQKLGYKPNHKFMPKTEVIQKNKIFINDNYFEVIDTEHKAYWLGFLYADGYISETKNNIELSLKESDLEHLKLFQKDLESKHELKKKIKDNCYISYRLSFNSKKMKQDLIKKGCIPNKSLVLKFPNIEQVPQELIPHFIRGYFDGDGCITKHATSSISLEILGTEELLKGICDYFNIKGHIYTFNHSSVKRFMIAGNEAIKILDCLYKDSTIHLNRKFDKFAVIRQNSLKSNNN